MNKFNQNSFIKSFVALLVVIIFSSAAVAQQTNSTKYYELTQIKFTKKPTKLEDGELELYLSQNGQPCSSSLCAKRVAFNAQTIFRVQNSITHFSDEELLSLSLKQAEVVLDVTSNTVLNVNFNEPIF